MIFFNNANSASRLTLELLKRRWGKMSSLAPTKPQIWLILCSLEFEAFKVSSKIHSCSDKQIKQILCLVFWHQDAHIICLMFKYKHKCLEGILFLRSFRERGKGKCMYIAGKYKYHISIYHCMCYCILTFSTYQ